MKLNEAITANNIDEVRKSVQRRKKPFNISFLIEAISLERREIIEILIAHTSNFDVISDTGCSALEVAVDIGDIETVKRLLKAGADPDLGNPLITAVRKKNYDIITTLTSAGASTTLQDGSDVSALSLATLQGDLKALKLMINDQNVLTVKDEYEQTLLEIAAANGHVDIFEHILPYFADKEKEKCREILSLGIKRKERLLDSYSNCFFEAIDSGQVDVIRDFLSSGKSPDMLNINGKSALHIAAEGERLDIISILVSSFCNLDILDENLFWTPLLYAINSGHKNSVRLLLSAGADPNVTTLEGQSAIMLAIILSPTIQITGYKTSTEIDYLEMVKMLLDSGADPNLRDRNGHTALMIAEYLNQENFCKLLVTGNAIRDGMEIIDFLKAVKVNNLKGVKSLIESGVNVVCKDYTGKSSLLLAIETGDFELVEALLKKYPISEDFNKGLRLAYDKSYIEITNLLVKFGASAKLIEIHKISEHLDRALITRRDFELSQKFKICLDGLTRYVLSEDLSQALSLAQNKGYFEIVELVQKLESNLSSLQDSI